MREIKFRGKSLNCGEWYYGNLFDKDTAGRTHIGTTKKGCLNIDPETVGQFTGLKDKNGKEIYEGDVVRDYEGVIHYVRWSEGDGCFDFTGSPYALSDDCEVIGNIHDNPELLKHREQNQKEL